MAATICVVAETVAVLHKGRLLGTGSGMYELRDFNPSLDIFAPASIEEGVSSVVLELGETIGRVTIRTRAHDTAIDVEASSSSLGLGSLVGGTAGGIIFDETYGYGTPRPVSIVDSNKNVLAIVTHQ